MKNLIESCTSIVISSVVISSVFLLILINCSGSNVDAQSNTTRSPEALATLLKTSNPQYPDLTVTLDSNAATPTLLITGFTNNISGEIPTWTLLIDQNQDFTTTPTRFTVQPSSVITSELITTSLNAATNPAEPTTYTLKTLINGPPISEWLTPSKLISYFSGATFAEQPIATQKITVNGTNIAIDGSELSNTANGRLLLSTEQLPLGYQFSGHDSLIDPDGPGLNAITSGRAGTLTITEIHNPSNIITYPVEINLAAYQSLIEASHITATNFDGAVATTSDISISKTTITISNFTNTYSSSRAGRIVFTPPPSAPYTITPNQLTFENPNNITNSSVEIGFVAVTDKANLSPVLYNVIVNFTNIDITLMFTATNIRNNPATIGLGESVIITNSCELFLPSAVTATDIPSHLEYRIVLPTYYNREEHSYTNAMFRVPAPVTIIDANTKNVINDLAFSVNIDFTPCTTTDLAGNGLTETSAYQIDTAYKLELVSHLINHSNATYADKFYTLTTDIDLGNTHDLWSQNSQVAGSSNYGGFPHIGSSRFNPFKGTFDCGNNTISNLYIHKPTEDTIALFGATSNATIKNCHLSNVTITGNTNVGSLVAANYSSQISHSSVTSGSLTANRNIGGLIGYNQNTSIANSYAQSLIRLKDTPGNTNTHRHLGGLVGYNLTSPITNSYAIGNIIGSYATGGLIGYNLASPISASYGAGTITGNYATGGLVGYNTSFEQGTYKNEASIENSYATASVTGNTFMGGLAGYNDSTVAASYSINNVRIFSLNPVQNPVFGLFIGRHTNTHNQAITNSYYNNEANIIVIPFLNLDPTPLGANSSPVAENGLIGLPEAELKVEQGTSSQATYYDWDSTLWKFQTGFYPRLKNVACPSHQYADPIPSTC